MLKEGIDVLVGSAASGFSVTNAPPRTAALLAGYANKYLPSQGVDGGQVDFVGLVEKEKPLVAAISVMAWEEMIRLPRLVGAIKTASPNTLVVVGGRYPTLFTSEVFRDAPGTDFVIRSYAEDSWPKLIEALSQSPGMDPNRQIVHLREYADAQPGVYHPKKNDSLLTPSPYVPLLQVEQPDYSLLTPGVNTYLDPHRGENWNQLHQSKITLDVITHIGCYWDCAFCVNAAMRNVDGPNKPTVELRPPKQVIQELKTLIDIAGFPVLPMFLTGPNSFVDPAHLSEILKQIIASGLNERARFSMDTTAKHYLRAARMGHGLFDDLQKAGVWRIKIGLEHLDEGVQNYIQKKTSLEDIEELIHHMAEKGTTPEIEVVIGLPPESEETISTLQSGLLQLRDSCPPFSVNFHTATPYPGTQLHEDVIREGLMMPGEQIKASMKGG